MIDIDRLIEEMRKESEQKIEHLSQKYNIDVKQFLSESENWHHQLVWDDKKINTYLKSCPFCGAKAQIEEFQYNDGTLSYAIECTECDAMSAECDERVEAIIKWNRRV